MALDTLYRPVRFDDVLGQEATIQVVREFVRKGTAFHQSYMFCGERGRGKTTIARILARAMLCADPQEGNPCDECPSCVGMLDLGVSEVFVEFDAATNSGKENILRIVEELKYSTFAGKRRIYLFDESHRLSKAALDGLLKPMEDTDPETGEKLLVCLFCTTEPEKMRSTVLSRCAPAFTVRVVPPDRIAARLAYICDHESIPYEMDALLVIAESTECHIRDAIKTVEGVSMLGDVTRANTNRYLRLDTHEPILKILALLGSDLGAAIQLADSLSEALSPTTLYTKLAEACMLAYKVHLGAAKAPIYWRPDILDRLGKHHKDYLVTFAQELSRRPRRPTMSMLDMDLALLHQTRSGLGPLVPVQQVVKVEVPANGTSSAPDGTSESPESKIEVPAPAAEDPSTMSRTTAWETSTGVHVDPRGIKKGKRSGGRKQGSTQALSVEVFRDALADRVEELSVGGQHGHERPPELGSPGTDPERGSTG